ncbi:hypothetical protein DICVIV_01150 [Dictyocaulus viviparus]|uniref:Uncharacterized protein n=1 Tax=Dictyocaulus viviparus TaxID=29172 RepID=A0A0D8Y9Q1_DICVI|nr:hypothetical protein DICVIV_01150 [Dictyocaulus viviparus]
MYGIPEGYTDTSPGIGVCIASLFAAKHCGRVINRRIANAASFTPVLNYIEPKKPPVLEDIPIFRRNFPIDWKRNSTTSDHLLSNEIAIEWHKWSPLVARVPPIEVEWLNSQGYCTMEQEYLVNIEGSQTQSPYEFYARPIKKERVHCNKYMIEGIIFITRSYTMIRYCTLIVVFQLLEIML